MVTSSLPKIYHNHEYQQNITLLYIKRWNLHFSVFLTLLLTNGLLFFNFSITLGLTGNQSFHEERQTDVLSELIHLLPKDVTQKKIDTENLKKKDHINLHANPLDSCENSPNDQIFVCSLGAIQVVTKSISLYLFL